MLKRFNSIFDRLRNVAEDERSTVATNLTPQLKTDTLRYCKILCQHDEVTKFVQTENISLFACRLALDSIAESVDEGKSNPNLIFLNVS